jgi:hypothetical protein
MKKVLILLIVLCVSSCNTEKELFSTPENTILTYYAALEKNELDLINECFYGGNFTNNSNGKYWDSIHIKSVKKMSEIDIVEYENMIRRKYDKFFHQEWKRSFQDNMINDVELIVRQKYPNNIGRFEYVDFLYLLRNIDGKWKVVSHSAISGKTWTGEMEQIYI